MGLQAVRGTSDFLDDEVRRWSVIEHTVRRIARLYGYGEIRTPLIEDAALFSRSVGETTDIVQKEMFRVADRGDQEMVLRPEGTASVVRAYLEHHLHKTQGFAKLFYLGPMFRAERPQAGRFRQFHQYGVEAIGSKSPWVDVEVVVLCWKMLESCGLDSSKEHLWLWLSSMGCREDQANSAEELRNRLTPDKSKLCGDCQARFEKNVFRTLDCKNTKCMEIALGIRDSLDHEFKFSLCGDCETHFKHVQDGVGQAGIPFDTGKTFARGLDYYTRTIFEVRVGEGLGAQDAVAAGGRYDHLVEELGGPSLGAVGFAAGIERVLLAAQSSATGGSASLARRGVYLAIVPPTPVAEGFRLVQQLRERGVRAIMGYDEKSLKAQLREADQADCQCVAILGERELKDRTISLRELGPRSCSRELGKSERTVPLDTFVDEVSQQMKPSCH